jgi:hypothetical protein
MDCEVKPEFARHSELASLRPMMSLSALAEVVGSESAKPDNNGDIFQHFLTLGFSARIDVEGRIGRLGFSKKFPMDCVIEKMQIGMSLDAARASRPKLEYVETDDRGVLTYKDITDNGDELTARFKDGDLIGFDLERPGLDYVRSLPAAYKLLTKRYDLTLSQPAPQQPWPAAQWRNGWILGLPAGISKAQWPLSYRTGFPLRHAFTLHVPEQYRPRGVEFVALSLFVDEQFEELETVTEIEEFMASEASGSDQPPSDPGLLLLWESRRNRHPQYAEMSDDLDTRYVAIWLTQAEFEGELCTPPDLSGNPLLADMPPPGWLTNKIAEYYGDAVTAIDQDGNAIAWPDAGCLNAAAAIGINQVTDDPNIGKPAREWDHENEASGYITAFSARGEEQDLSRFEFRNHLGGTMFPIQGYPEFGPFYIEFEEYFGGFNFGSGNCRIDLETMKLDWSC